jgi:uncharacterized RDD family membrane protein YckC
VSGFDSWQVETPGQVALSLPLAGVGARGMAALLDLLAIFLCWMVGLFLYSIWGDLLGRWQGLSWLGQLALVGAILAAGWGWDVAWEVAWRGQTPGKRALGLRVIRLDGASVGLAESLVRNALRVVELPLLYAPRGRWWCRSGASTSPATACRPRPRSAGVN